MGLILYAILITLIYFLIVFYISEVNNRADFLDIAWGLGFILIAWANIFSQELISLRMLIIAILTTIWGLRLSIHIYLRNKDKKEDYRYQEMKKDPKNNTSLKRFFRIYLPQAIFMILISFPMILTTMSDNPNSSLIFLDYIGILIWLFGFVFETISDIQLSKFITKKKQKETKKRFLTSGLWKYSRHPNYFGEILVWWGIFLISVSSFLGVFTIISPLTITILITLVSGIPLLEKKYEGNKEYEEYKRDTRSLIPIRK